MFGARIKRYRQASDCDSQFHSPSPERHDASRSSTREAGDAVGSKQAHPEIADDDATALRV